ncbi:MAG: two-component regulator propeller domain-containing protein [Bacteroidales bacterium]
MLRRILFCCALLMSLYTLAQRPLLFNKAAIENPQVRFIRLTTDEGLSNNRVTALLQDSFGFIWVGTVDGLNRYDGRTFEVYKHNPDNFTSLSSSHISSLVADNSGNLYIGTKNGINIYDRLNNSFVHLKLRGDSTVHKEPYVREMLFQNDSILWIDTQEGLLMRYNTISNKVLKVFRHEPSPQPYYLYHDLYLDTHDRLWVGVRGRSIMFLNLKTGGFEKVDADENDFTKKRARDVACYYEDSQGNFWISALDGVYLMNKSNYAVRKFFGITTFDIREDKKGDIWFATGSGIYKYSHATNTMMAFANQKDNPHSISNNSVHKILEDQVGNMWFATSMGVNIYNPSAFPFGTYTHIPGITNSPEGYVVTAAAEDNLHNLWIGYEEDGMDYFNTRTDRFAHYVNSPGGKNQLASNNVSALYFDKNNRLWIGLWRGIGFNLYEPDKDRFSLFTYYTKNLEKDWYSDFCEDDEGNFYIGFWGADGLVRFHRDQLKFGESLQYKFQRTVCSRIITRLFHDNQNTIWVGTTECGLHRYYPKGDSAVAYFYDGADSSGLASDDIKDICQDIEGNIWVLTSTLQKYDHKTKKFNKYGYSDGFYCSDPVSILPDRQGNLWIATKGDGLYKFEPGQARFTQYLKQDGLQGNTFTSARLALSDGHLFFGGVSGFNLFHPNEIRVDSVVPKPFFGRLFVYDHIYSHDLNQISSIILKPKDKVFSIELNSTDQVNPERYLYQCKLVGFDENWVDVDNIQRKLRFASVPPGTYQLNYRIGNRNGNWSNEMASVSIVIQRPFYQTTWFIILVIVLFITVLFLYVKRREYEHKLQRKAIELQQRVFRLQMNPHFMGNSLLAIQNFIYGRDPKEAGNYLSDFARLFRLILNNSKSEFILLSKELETLELYLRLQNMRFPGKFDYTFEIDDAIDPEEFLIPPMLAQPMIENAIEHGLFTKVGKGTLKIRFLHGDQHLIFEVDDDGIGLTAARKLNLIQDTHQSTALQITRERIEILGKRYRFNVLFEVKEKLGDNNQSLGTIVRFTLPYRYSTDIN